MSAAEDALNDAVTEWVKENGGTLVVVGGVEVQYDPLGPEFNFKVAVRCTGVRPTKNVPG